MLNGINLNDDLNSVKDGRLAVNGVATNPISNPYKNVDRSMLIDETAISDQAVQLYQKEQDVKGFNELALSDPEDMSHEDIISSLFGKGVVDPFSDEALESVASNKSLLADIENISF